LPHNIDILQQFVTVSATLPAIVYNKYLQRYSSLAKCLTGKRLKISKTQFLHSEYPTNNVKAPKIECNKIPSVKKQKTALLLELRETKHVNNKTSYVPSNKKVSTSSLIS